MHGRAYEADEGPAVPLLDLNSVQRFISRYSESQSGVADHAVMRSLMRPLIHWATRKQDRHAPIGQKLNLNRPLLTQLQTSILK